MHYLMAILHTGSYVGFQLGLHGWMDTEFLSSAEW